MVKSNLKNFLNYILIFLIILDCRSVYVHILGIGIGNIIIIAIIILLSLLILYYNNGKFRLKLLMFILGYYIYISILYFLIVNQSKISFISRYMIIFPLLIIYFFEIRKDGAIELLKKYSNVIVIISIISLFFYVFGSLLNVIDPTGKVTIQWGNIKSINTYFFIHFDIQIDKIFFIRLIRNTSIFTEAPMYALHLLIALFATLFYYKRINKFKISIILISIATSLSTTAILLGIFLIIIKYIKKINRSNIKLLIIPFILCIGGYFAINIFIDKMTTSSYNIRQEDIRAVLYAIKNKYIIGRGFMNNESVAQYMSSFRSNTGLSSAFLIVLLNGGIYFSIFYLLPFVLVFIKSIRLKRRDITLFIIMQFLFYFVFVYQYTVLALFLCSYNIFFILSKDNKKNSIVIS